eukprot:PhM_4_TR19007/c0_g1_i1/m.66932
MDETLSTYAEAELPQFATGIWDTIAPSLRRLTVVVAAAALLKRSVPHAVAAVGKPGAVTYDPSRCSSEALLRTKGSVGRLVDVMEDVIPVVSIKEKIRGLTTKQKKLSAWHSLALNAVTRCVVVPYAVAVIYASNAMKEVHHMVHTSTGNEKVAAPPGVSPLLDTLLQQLAGPSYTTPSEELMCIDEIVEEFASLCTTARDVVAELATPDFFGLNVYIGASGLHWLIDAARDSLETRTFPITTLLLRSDCSQALPFLRNIVASRSFRDLALGIADDVWVHLSGVVSQSVRESESYDVDSDSGRVIHVVGDLAVFLPHALEQAVVCYVPLETFCSDILTSRS